MTNRTYSTGAMIAAIVFPLTMLADVTGTVTLNSGQQLNLGTGAVVSSGGDLQWTGSAINFLGGAKGFDLPGNSAAAFAGLSETIIQQEAVAFSPSSIPSSSLVSGNVFVLETGSGSFAKVLVANNGGSSITLQFDMFGAGGNPGGGGNAPAISAVLDAGSNTENIAPGGIFVVKGTNLSASGYTASQQPYPKSISGVSINFTPQSGGAATQAYMIYLFNQNGTNQLSGILPSTITPGSYQVTVTSNGSTSAPFSAQVVANKPGLFTQDTTGNGLAVVQNYVSAAQLDINRFTTGTVSGVSISPAHPGQTLIVWLTGMGAVPFADNDVPPGGAGYNFLSNGGNIQVFVGGTALTPFFAGRTPCCAAEDQIDVTLPTNIPTGCAVEMHVVVNGNASQSTFISIAPNASSTTCVLQGFTTSQLQNLDNGGSVTTGVFTVQQSNISALGQSLNFASAGGEFYRYSAFEIAGASSAADQFPNSGCFVTPIPFPGGNNVATGTGTVLDAGTIKLTGPANSSLSAVPLTEKSNLYTLSFSGFGAAVNGNFVPGTYTLNGSGGTDVGPFSASINVPTILTVSNMPSTITRSAGLTLNWTGGNSSDPVIVNGEAENKVNGVETGATFTCITTAGAGSITVPASILNQLPAVTASAESGQTGVGGLDVLWSAGSFTGSNFSAPLTAGGSIDMGVFTATTSTVSSAVFQ